MTRTTLQRDQKEEANNNMEEVINMDVTPKNIEQNRSFADER
jgi:hypothetical protein